MSFESFFFSVHLIYTTFKLSKKCINQKGGCLSFRCVALLFTLWQPTTHLKHLVHFDWDFLRCRFEQLPLCKHLIQGYK